MATLQEFLNFLSPPVAPGQARGPMGNPVTSAVVRQAVEQQNAAQQEAPQQNASQREQNPGQGMHTTQGRQTFARQSSPFETQGAEESGGNLISSLLSAVQPFGQASPGNMFANAPGVARGIYNRLVGGGGVPSASADRESASQEPGPSEPRFAVGASVPGLSSQPSQPTTRQSPEGSTPAPSPAPQQNLEPAQQVPPAQQEAARSQWQSWLSDPNNRAMLLTTGLALMQPVGVGQTGAGHLSRAIGLGAEAGAEQRSGQEARAAAQQEAAREERKLDIRAQRENRLSRTGGVTPYQAARLEQSEIGSFNDFVQGQIEAITDGAISGNVPEWAKDEDGRVLSAPELEQKLLGPLRERTVEAFRRRRQTAQEAIGGSQAGSSAAGGAAGRMSSQEAVQRMQQQYPEVWRAIKAGEAPLQVVEQLRSMVHDPEVLDQLIQSQ